MKILLTGATGLIGSSLCKKLIKRNDEVFVFTRNPEKGKRHLPEIEHFIKWDYTQPDEWKEHLNDKDAVIHLAGANLFARRWNDSYKKIIVESRKMSTRNLVESIKKMDKKPSVFISSSAVGYYGNKGEELLTEDAPPGDDFLAMLCAKWEEEASKIESSEVRRVSIRTGVILNPKKGALKEMLTPFKFFVGGPLGNGRQWFPWIHMDDIINIYLFALDNASLSGPVNAMSPNPVRMKDFADTLGKVLKRPSFFYVPEFVMKIVVGEVAGSVTSSIKAIPKKLMEINFNFLFKDLEVALRDLLKR